MSAAHSRSIRSKQLYILCKDLFSFSFVLKVRARPPASQHQVVKQQDGEEGNIPQQHPSWQQVPSSYRYPLHSVLGTTAWMGQHQLAQGALHKGLSPHELIVWCIVDHIKDTGLAGNSLTSPWVVTSIQAESPPLHITSSDTDPPHRLVAWQLGVGWLAAKLIPTDEKRN